MHNVRTSQIVTRGLPVTTVCIVTPRFTKSSRLLLMGFSHAWWTRWAHSCLNALITKYLQYKLLYTFTKKEHLTNKIFHTPPFCFAHSEMWIPPDVSPWGLNNWTKKWKNDERGLQSRMTQTDPTAFVFLYSQFASAFARKPILFLFSSLNVPLVWIPASLFLCATVFLGFSYSALVIL